MNILMNTLWTNKAHLGQVLHLQLDNCARENKNRYLLCFASLLVDYHIFREVYINFLPVGHTHEDIDQMFSRVATKIKRTNVYTLEDLYSTMRGSYSPEIITREVRQVYDIKDWLVPHMYATFANHSKPHCFRFKTVKGKVRMHYRLWSSDEWRPRLEPEEECEQPAEDCLGLQCLQTVPDIYTVPEWVKPSLDKLDPDALVKDMPLAYSGRFQHSVMEWWRDFIANLDKLKEIPEEQLSWPLMQLVQHRQQHPLAEQESALPEALKRIEQKLCTDCPPIIIGDQGKAPPPNTVTLVEDFSTVKEGALVALYVKYVKERPQVGRVTIMVDVTNLTMEVHWQSCTWTGPCKPLYNGVGANRKSVTELLDIRMAILWDFSLTKKGCLKASTQEELRKQYLELDALDQ